MLRRYLLRLLLIALYIQLMGMGARNTPPADHITVIAVGDIMMGSTYPVDILPGYDGMGIFDSVSEAFKRGDMVFGNLESPLLDGGKASKCEDKNSSSCFEFRTPTRYAQYLKDAGFNAVSIANNHILDFGLEGAKQTVETLSIANIKAAGGNTVANLEIRNKSIAIAGFSFSPSSYAYSILDIDGAARIVKELKKTSDIVIISFHGGAEGAQAIHVADMEELFLGENRGNVVRFARSVVDAGADLVIGHGPHVLRAMEVYKGKLIAYSLGNFLTYGRFNIKGPGGISLILKARIDSKTGNFAGGELIPVKLANGGIAEPDPDNLAIKLIKWLTSEDITNPGVSISDSGIVSKLTEAK